MFSFCYKTNCKRHTVHYWVMDAIGSLLSTQKARNVLGYRLGRLLRFFRAQQPLACIHYLVVYGMAFHLSSVTPESTEIFSYQVLRNNQEEADWTLSEDLLVTDLIQSWGSVLRCFHAAAPLAAPLVAINADSCMLCTIGCVKRGSSRGCGCTDTDVNSCVNLCLNG